MRVLTVPDPDDAPQPAERDIHLARVQRDHLARFQRDEDGSLVMFSFFLLIGILLVGGFAVDLMRAETRRAELQAVADTATLAAAASTQERNPTTVVQDYFAAAGLSNELDSVQIAGVVTAREVTANTSSQVPTTFLRMAGINNFTASVSSTATEKISAVELSMVLDISGSMRGDKLTRLQDASADFVDAIFGSLPTSESMVSIVPYTATVAAGPDILAQLNVTDEHDYSHCIEFDADHFETVGLSMTEEYRRAGHFDPFSSYHNSTWPEQFVCRTEQYAEILPYSNDPVALRQKIYSLEADGNTGIDNGLKWGAALLDTSARPILAGLVDDGVVNAEFDGRPHSLEEYPGIKVVVLMTDGQNTSEYRLRPQYRDGLVDVWMHNTDVDRVSIQDEEYMNQDGDGRHWEDFWRMRNHRFSNSPDGGWNGSYQMTYPQLWNRFSVRYHAYLRYLVNGWSSQYYAWDNEPYTSVSGSEKDDRLLDICAATKASGIVIYTLAVEAPTSSNNLLRSCATSPSHHFDVDRFDIGTAFGAIITSINHLRLTQ